MSMSRDVTPMSRVTSRHKNREEQRQNRTEHKVLRPFVACGKVQERQGDGAFCAVCGSPHNIERAHLENKGMGGRGKKAPDSASATIPLCAGSGGNTDPTSCHGAQHAG